MVAVDFVHEDELERLKNFHFSAGQLLRGGFAGRTLPAPSKNLSEDATMPKVTQASTRKRTTKAGTLSALGAAGLSLSLAGHAAASTIPNANVPQTDNT